ncbi:MAG: sporulation protein YqfD [Clostridia bacterium]|nr:sporulation protein YqfD [Clostridia bacterium]
MGGFLRYITGTRRVRIVCGDGGKLLSECVRRHVHIWNIIRKDVITYEFSLYTSSFGELEDIAKRIKCELTVIREQSLIKQLFRYRHRKVFAAGFIMFLGIIAFVSAFISDITVEGNKDIPTEEIIAELSEAGFKEGMFRYGINVRKIQQSMMLRYSKLTWIWIDIHGTHATVSVQERIAKPDIEDKTDYCNLVASRDALITELMPRGGRPAVKIGDVVRKGDVLISGIADTKTGGIRYMHADGIAKGRTWYELDGVYSHTRCDRYLTGNEEKRLSLTVGTHVFPVFSKNTTTFKLYEHSKNEQKFKFFKKTLPISFTIDAYCEIIEEHTEISDSDVVSTAVSVLSENLSKSLEGKKELTVISKTHTSNKLDSGNIYVKVCFECSEDIGEYKPIEHPQYVEINEQEEQ